MRKICTSYRVKYDLNSMFKSWALSFSSFTNTTYFQNLMSFLKGEYILNMEDKNMVPSDISSVFKMFRYTEMEELKVVIVGTIPYKKPIEYNGILYSSSITDFKTPHPISQVIQENVERTMHDGMDLHFDYSLKNWCQQGVLLLPTALTCEKDKSGVHEIYWKHFIRGVLKQINKENDGVIFCFWGINAKYFSPLIDQKFNYVLEGPTPEESLWIETPWDMSHFEEVNEILEENYGAESKIVW